MGPSEMLEYVLKCRLKLCLMTKRQKTWMSIQKQFKNHQETMISWPAKSGSHPKWLQTWRFKVFLSVKSRSKKNLSAELFGSKLSFDKSSFLWSSFKLLPDWIIDPEVTDNKVFIFGYPDLTSTHLSMNGDENVRETWLQLEIFIGFFPTWRTWAEASGLDS